MLCCIFNYAPHYRLAIYLELAKNCNAHFYFGATLRNIAIKKLEFAKLHGFKKELKVLFFNWPLGWEWCDGMVSLAFKKEYKTRVVRLDCQSIFEVI